MTEKIALISGANKSIGYETARQLGSLGMTVLVGAAAATPALGSRCLASLDCARGL